MKLVFDRRGLGAALLITILSGCGDATVVGTRATVTVMLTDAPADYIGEAMVDIGAVELLGGDDGPIVLSEDGTDGPVNLLELRDAATIALASEEVEAGTYGQLRLIVESASVTLAPGYEFRDGVTSRDLTIPSGAQTGIKLNLKAGAAEEAEGGDEPDNGIEIMPGETALVLDFDVSRSFVIQGNPETPAGIHGVSFKPTLRVIVSDVAGSISGTVSTAVAGAAVVGLVVTAEPVSGTTLEPFQMTSATAVTDADGAYTIFFLVPGDYQVSVDAGAGLTADVVDVTVGEGEDVEDVDFEVVAG